MFLTLYSFAPRAATRIWGLLLLYASLHFAALFTIQLLFFRVGDNNQKLWDSTAFGCSASESNGNDNLSCQSILQLVGLWKPRLGHGYAPIFTMLVSAGKSNHTRLGD